MSVLIAGTGSFLIAFACHVALWRIRVPRHQALTLILIYTVVAVLALVPVSVLGPEQFGFSPLRLVLTLLLFGSFGVVYLILFSALEADSPTLTILTLIQESGTRGVTHDELLDRMVAQSFVRDRLDKMLRDGMAIRTGDQLHLGKQGLLLILLILQYRKLLGRERPGG